MNNTWPLLDWNRPWAWFIFVCLPIYKASKSRVFLQEYLHLHLAVDLPNYNLCCSSWYWPILKDMQCSSQDNFVQSAVYSKITLLRFLCSQLISVQWQAKKFQRVQVNISVATSHYLWRQITSILTRFFFLVMWTEITTLFSLYVQAESAKKLKFDHGLVGEGVVELGELAATSLSRQGSSNCRPRYAHRLGASSYTQEEDLKSDDDEQLRDSWSHIPTDPVARQ